MKQTNNALKYLLAQYRAIFKNAYFKGIASAVLLTAGLAVASTPAQAAWVNGTTTPDGVLTVDDFNSSSISNVAGHNETISSNQTVDLNSGDWTTMNDWHSTSGTAFTGILTVQNGATVSIEGAADRTFGMRGLTVQNGATLNLSNTNKTNTSILGYVGTAENTVTGEYGTFTVDQKSTVNLTQFGVEFNDVKVSDGSVITLGGLKEKDYDNAVNKAKEDKTTPEARRANYSHIYAVGAGTNGVASVSDSTINLNHESFFAGTTDVQFNGASVVNFAGELVDLDDEAKPADNKDIVYTGDDYASSFIMGSNRVVFEASFDNEGKIIAVPQMNVADGKYGAIYAKAIRLRNADINVGQNGTLILDGLFGGKTADKVGQHSAALIILRDVNANNQGTIVLGNSASGGTTKVAGLTDMQGQLVNYTNLMVKNNNPETDDGKNKGHLIISEDQLLKHYDADNNLLPEGVFAGANVGVILQSAKGKGNAILELVGTDADGLDLNKDVSFVSQNDIDKYEATAEGSTAGDSETRFYAGKIFVRNNGTIKGEHLVLHKGLDLADISKLTLDGRILDLGSADYSGGTLSGLGIEAGIAHDDLSLNASGTIFTVDKGLTLSRDYYTKDASGDYTTTPEQVANIHGDNIVIGNAKASASGSITVSGGAWQNADRQSLTITSGSLSVGAVQAADLDGDGILDTDDQLDGNDGLDDGWKYYKNGNPASLTWHGTFDIKGASNTASNANINVTGATGADATLDLTDANITWGAGTITVSSTSTNEDGDHISATDYFARAGHGILKITGTELSDFLDLTGYDDDKTATLLDLQKGGVLLVDGAVTGDIDFSKITSSTAGTAGNINFNSDTGKSGGWLVSTGELSLVNKGEDAATLNLGEGAIVAQGLSVTDKATNKTGTDAADNVVTVSGGTLFVAERFTSANKEVVFNGGSLLLDAHGMAEFGVDNASNVGTVAVNKLTFSGSADSSLEVYTGDWTLSNNSTLSDINFTDGAKLQVGSWDDYLRLGHTASLTADNISMVITADPDNVPDINIEEGSKATFNTIQAENADINVDGTLTLLGRTDIDVDLETEPETLADLGKDANTQAGISLNNANITVDGGNLVFGDTAANALVKLSLTTSGDTTTSAVDINETLTSANINLTNGAVLKLDYTSGSAATINGGKGLTAEQARLLKQNLVDRLDRGSYINVGQVALNMPYDPNTMTTQWDQVKDFVQVSSDVTNEVMPQVLLQGVSAGDQISGHFAAVQGDTVGMTTISVDGDLWLHKAWQNADGNKYFAFTDSKKPIGLSLGSYSSLSLYGEGIVGTLAGNGTAGDSLVLFKEGEFQPGITTVSGSITGIGEIIVDNDVVVTNDVKVGAVDISKSLQAPTVTIDGQNGASLITGTLSATQSLNIGEGTHDAAVYVADGTVNTTNLTLTDGSLLQVGWDAADTDDVDTTDFNEAANYSGRLEVTGALKLNSGELYVDPAYNQPTALASINNLSGTQQTDLFADTLDGSIFVGRNSALGIGSDSLATLEEKIARFQHNGSLVENEVGAVVYLGKAFTLGSGESLVLTNQTLEGFTNYYNTAASTNYAQSAILGSLNDTVYLGDNTAILVSAPVASRAEVGGTPLISFAGATGKVIADGGDIVIDGDVRAATYQVFESGSSITYVNNTAYAPVEDAEAPAYEDNINVTTENDFLQGVVGADGTVTLGVNPQGRAIMRGASDPVYASLVAYARGYNGSVPTDEEVAAHQVAAESGYTQIAGVSDDRLLYSYDAQGNRVYGQYSNYFLQETISTGDGTAAEAVARLAVFGGAAQAAITAGSSSYEAISGRMGMGATGYNLTVADNTQGAALWVTPMYKSSESDGFDAEGVDYGVDLNLYGVALGADYTLANGVSFGAMFNVGSGDVDGKDAGSAVSNDFDYYGFGVYGGFSANNFKVVADLTYTVADNDLEANTSIDTVGASIDTSNLSLGVTAQYAFDFTGASVTPHAGLRYSYIDMDDYDVDGEGTVASYDGDSMGIFSIPVGVTVAKEFVGGNWSVKPSFDLTLTGNFGDDETDGTVHWAGVENLSTNVSSEVIDNFTYGATLGVAAKTGNFSLGLGVNYTGSSSTDEYGVKANARFVF
ncbi:MAG: autotransporter outer membrane beta-barrel domain-containing protein [Candidatus Anaerobiospirillum pullicola]|uniref:Autotransporter outer membrane beta-barrel domain-containing protein n=1 Tax=Candidatus Anaerobiospirillum pullicola TaxID=2838451 RepID=A0A948TIG5_9GAMM|nr:autotransporter outer membrane beta-barrel domain-containing protein [Candidatus Anaerobiospirillum pullicola]